MSKLYSPRVLRWALLVTQTLLSLACGYDAPPETPVYDAEVCVSPSGTKVYFQTPRNPGLTCEGFTKHEAEIFESFQRNGLDVARLKERLPYARVIVVGDGHHVMLGGKRVGGHAEITSALVTTRSAPLWEGTALAHEYAHLAEDGDAKHGHWRAAWTVPYYRHEGWCGNYVWRAVAEARGVPFGGSSCRYGVPTLAELREAGEDENGNLIR